MAGDADPVEELQRRRRDALAMGGQERVARHHDSGRLTVRERIDGLVDEGSWFEFGLLAQPERRDVGHAPPDAVVTGCGLVDGRKVCLLGVDATVLGGTTAPVNMRKQGRILDFAGRNGLPVIVLSDADGGRIPDVMGWRFSGLPFDFRSFLQSPDECPAVPRVTALLGPSFGDAALHAAAADFVVMTSTAAVALSGPPIVASATGEDVDATALGGPGVAAENGTVHHVVQTEDEAFGAIRRFLSYLPSSAAFRPPAEVSRSPAVDADRMSTLVPDEPRRAYDMRRVVAAVADADSVFAWAPQTGRSLLTCLARIEGEAVGIVANQPMHRAGVLDPPALAKELAFVELCDTFNLPLVFLHDVPGLMIGVQAERQRILAGYESVVARLARTTVPKVGVVVRKSYGGGHFAMGGRPTRPDFLACWPGAELGFMAPETGVRTLHRRKLASVRADDGAEVERRLVEELTTEWQIESRPWEAAAHYYVDDIIDPASTRDVVRTAVEFAWGSRRPPVEAP